MIAGDTITMSRILTDDCHLLHMTGYNQSKEEWLKHMDSGRMRYFKSEEHNVRVEIDRNDKVIVIGQNQVDADIWGARGSWPLQMKLHCLYQADRLMISDIEATMY